MLESAEETLRVIGVTLTVTFFAFFWVFSPYWPGALIIIALDLVVIYALSPMSEDREYA